MHETFWNTAAARTASAAGHRVAAGRNEFDPDRRPDRLRRKRGVLLAPSLSQERERRLAVKARSRQAPQTKPDAKKEVDAFAAEGAVVLRVCHRPVDPKKNWAGDRKGIRDWLPPQPSLAVSDPSWLELPKTGEEGSGERRRENPALEALGVAPYKKRPSALTPTSFSWMNRVSSWSPASGAPGRCEARPPSLRWPADGPKSRPFRRLASPLKEGGLRFMRGFTKTKTSALARRPDSSGISCVISRVPLSCSGTAAPFMGERRSRKSLQNTAASMFIDFQAMPPSSIPMNLSGITSRGDWRTAFPKMRVTLSGSSAHRWQDCGSPRNFYGPAFMLRNYHGNSFYYLCVDQ